jgi:hypothetical protein
MKKVNYKKYGLATGALVCLSFTLFSCLWIRSGYCPETAETNSTFEIRLVLDDRYPLDARNSTYNVYGFVGVQLPVGWTVDAEELVFEYYPNAEKGGEYYEGDLEVDEPYTLVCENTMDGIDDYYWVGFSTLDSISEEKMDSIVVRIPVHTDDQVGAKFLTCIVNENGSGDNAKIPLDNGKIAVRQQGSDNGEGCTFYAEIDVREGEGNGIQTLTQADDSYQVLTLGDGRLRIDLSDSRKIGATATVYNMRGQMVAIQTLSGTENTLSAVLDRGVYSVAVQKDGVRSYKKVLVK